MKTKAIPAPFLHGSGPELREPRCYSLVETAQLLGLSFADLHDLLARNELHAEAGPHGSRVSQSQLFHYLDHREASATASANLFARFLSKR